MITISKFFATLATGLLAGSFLYGLLNLVPTFYEVPMDVHLIFRTQLMNHNSTTMQLLMLISILMPLWYAILHRKVKPVMFSSLVASLLALTALLVTRFGNVPINQMMKTWSINDLPVDWKILLHNWDQYNLIRCMAGIGSFICVVISTHLAFLKLTSNQTKL